MPPSIAWTEWHLTRRGWQPGSWQGERGSSSDSPPSTRVKTCIYYEIMSDVHQVLDHGVQTVWVQNTTRAAWLEKKFGPCPRRLHELAVPVR